MDTERVAVLARQASLRQQEANYPLLVAGFRMWMEAAADLTQRTLQGGVGAALIYLISLKNHIYQVLAWPYVVEAKLQIAPASRFPSDDPRKHPLDKEHKI